MEIADKYYKEICIQGGIEMRIDSFDSDKQMTSNETNYSTEANASTKNHSIEVEKISRISSESNSVERSTLPISEKIVIEAIEKANRAIEGARTEFKFSIHEQTHAISVKVIDKDKGEIIREIPPEKVLDMVAKMWEMAGIIVDEKR